MRNIITVFKKELTRVFRDPKLILMLLLPGALIFIMYTFIGSAVNSKGSAEEYKIYCSEMPADVKTQFEAKGLRPQTVESSGLTVSEIQEEIKNGNAEILLVFGENFADEDKDTKVDIYYNPIETKSSDAYKLVAEGLDKYKEDLIKSRHGYKITAAVEPLSFIRAIYYFTDVLYSC